MEFAKFPKYKAIYHRSWNTDKSWALLTEQYQLDASRFFVSPNQVFNMMDYYVSNQKKTQNIAHLHVLAMFWLMASIAKGHFFF